MAPSRRWSFARPLEGRSATYAHPVQRPNNLKPLRCIKKSYLCNADIHGRRAWTCRLDCSRDFAQVDLRNPIIVVDVADARHVASPAREEYLVRLGDPYRSLVRERQRGIDGDGANFRVRPEDVEELGVEDLEEGWGRVGGVEELCNGVLAEGPVNAEDVEREGIDELWVMDARWRRRKSENCELACIWALTQLRLGFDTEVLATHHSLRWQSVGRQQCCRCRRGVRPRSERDSDRSDTCDHL